MFLRSSAFAVLAGLAGLSGLSAPAEAQRGGRGGAIVLYEHANFQGRSARIDGDAPNLDWMNFNDMASSIRLEGGRWEVCVHADYGGSCHVVTEDLPNMANWAFNDQISSVRSVQFRGPGSDAGITLYAGTDYAGRNVTLTDGTPNLTRMGFNDQARSIQVHSGVWTVCVDDDYEGGCRTIDRSVSNLSRLGLDRRITSVRSGRHEEPGYPGGAGHGGEIDGEVRGVSTVFFPTPRIRGLEVAACSYGQSYRCGDEAANQLCRIAGHRTAVHFEVARARGGEAWYLDDRRPGRANEVLTDVLCTR